MVIEPIIFGFFLDLIFGDPKRFPHPVRFFGFCSKFFEKIFRKLIPEFPVVLSQQNLTL